MAWDGGVAVYPRCIRLGFMRDQDAAEFDDELKREVKESERVCERNGEVWLGNVRIGSLPIARRLILVRFKSGAFAECHNVENDGKLEQRREADVTNTLIQLLFLNFRATVWYWAEECIRKVGGLRVKLKVNWKQALLGEGLEGEEWASRDMVHVWNLLRKSILTELWWLYNRSLVEDASTVTARYLVQQIWLSLRLYIILEWLQVVKTKDEQLAITFHTRWLNNGFAGMRTTDWVLWMWEEPLLISKLNF